MHIVTRCLKCSAAYKLPEENVGRRAKCKCGHVFVVTKVDNAPATPRPPQHAPMPPAKPTEAHGHPEAERKDAFPSKPRWRWIAGAGGLVGVIAAGIGLWGAFGRTPKQETLSAQAKPVRMSPVAHPPNYRAQETRERAEAEQRYHSARDNKTTNACSPEAPGNTRPNAGRTQTSSRRTQHENAACVIARTRSDQEIRRAQS